MKYDILGAKTAEVLVEMVNEKLKDGWKLYGEYHPVFRNESFWHWQAIVKADEWDTVEP